MQTWFECKVKYRKIDQNGKEHTVNESYLVDAISFTDTEARIIDELATIVRGEFTVTDIRKSKISEVFPHEGGEWWFRVAINLTTIDEDAGKEKKLRSFYLVQADDVKEAVRLTEENLSFLIVPYVVTSIAVSNIIDVFPYIPQQKIPDNYILIARDESAGEQDEA